jgi:hypothetical protein
MTTPVRAVCANTVRAALERARSVDRVRHVGDPTGQLHEARAVLGMTVAYYRPFAAFGDRLALAPMGERAALGARPAVRRRCRARRTGARQPAPRSRVRHGDLPPRRHGRQRPRLEVVRVERDRRVPRPPRPPAHARGNMDAGRRGPVGCQGPRGHARRGGAAGPGSPANPGRSSRAAPVRFNRRNTSAVGVDIARGTPRVAFFFCARTRCCHLRCRQLTRTGAQQRSLPRCMECHDGGPAS